MNLCNIFGNKKLFTILSTFLNNPTKEFSQTEIINIVKIAKATAVKWLKLLTERSYISMKKIGTTNLYCLNQNNPLIKQLKIITIINLLEPLENLKDFNIEIYLYGSASRGEDNENSDIDLLIIGNIKRSEIINNIEDISEKISKPLNYTIFNQIEWSMLKKKDKPFYERVEKDKIKLL